jgi:hypothetical protein
LGRPFCARPCHALSDDLADRQQSGHHRDYQTTYHQTNHNDRRRSRDTDEAIEAALELGLVELGDPAGDHRQLSGLVAEPQHAHRHRGQHGGVRQRIRQLGAVPHPLHRLRPGGPVAGRGHHIGENAKRR